MQDGGAENLLLSQYCPEIALHLLDLKKKEVMF